MRANFQAINAAFSDNHAGLTGDSDIAGKHTNLTLRDQALDPTTSAVEVSLYNKLVSTMPQLFFMPSSNQTPIQMSYNGVGISTLATQYSYVAGPFIIYGGKVTSPVDGVTITLSPTSTLLSVFLTQANRPILSPVEVTVNPINIAGSSFDINMRNSTALTGVDVYYLAIGQP